MDYSPSILRTPKSERSSRRRSLFPHLEKLAQTPGIQMSPSPTKSKKKNLPAKFKQEMPRRSLDVQSPSETVSPVKTSTFYGSYVPKFLAKKEESKSLDSSFKEKMSLETPPKKQKVFHKKKEMTRSAPPKSRKFGINKGVSHGIKKPKANPKKSKSASDSGSEEEFKKTTPKTPKTPKPPKFTSLVQATTTPSSSGKIAVAKDKNVSFEIKNGQMAFRYRRSPRKHNTSPYFNKTRTPSSDPKTPKQLFTPSSKQDFINDWQASPPKSTRRGNLPSPVKFHKEDEDNDDDNQVSNIIDSLDKSQDDYAVYVTDDELARVAAETVQELEEIRQQETRDNLDLELHEILAKIEPPTAAEVNENRANFQLELEDSSNDGFESPLKAKKLFPVFDKKSTRRPLAELNKNRNAKNNNVQALDNDQMVIDAGQKNWTELITCMECSFVYNPGNKEDEEAHKRIHNVAQEGIRFQGWKNENVVGEFPVLDAKIIVVKPKDHSSHWAKAKEVLNLVDKQLGIVTDDPSQALRNKQGSQVYLFVGSGKIVGLLLSETLEDNDKVHRAVQDASGQWILQDLPKNSAKALVGISRIWVANDFRRQGIASKLVRAMEANFYGPQFLRKGYDYAFSHTTPDGSNFASKYTGKNYFLTYASNSSIFQSK